MATAAAPTVARASTLADAVYAQLHSDIVSGRIQPNSMVLEDEIAQAMRVSRTPVREALLRLAKDGLIVSRSRRWVAVQMTLQDIRDIYDVRCALEAHAARLTAARATDAQFDDIEEALARREGADTSEQLVATNGLFHRRIVLATGNGRLIAASDQHRHFYFNEQVARLYEPGDLTQSNRQHRDLMAALRRRDADAAAEITREHIAAALGLIEQRLLGTRA